MRRVLVPPSYSSSSSTPAARPKAIAGLQRCWHGAALMGFLHVDGVMLTKLTQASLAPERRLAICASAGLSGIVQPCQALTRPPCSAPRKPLLAPFCSTPGQAAVRCVGQLPGGSGVIICTGKSGILAVCWRPHETFAGMKHLHNVVTNYFLN